MDSVDVVVIGAGVVGLACAKQLAEAGREVIVLERETAFGTGISARNSEVIHAGLYYPPGSLKAALCVQGRRALYTYCAERGIAHRRIGKLVVASRAPQLPALEAIANDPTQEERTRQAASKSLATLRAATGDAIPKP